MSKFHLETNVQLFGATLYILYELECVNYERMQNVNGYGQKEGKGEEGKGGKFWSPHFSDQS